MGRTRMTDAVPGRLGGRRVRVFYAAVFALYAAGACRNVDVDTDSYATLAEAREAGAIARGWMPSLLPEGAVDIRVAYDRRSNRRWGLFSFSEAGAAAFKAVLQKEEASLAGQTLDVPGRIEWWPVQLRGTLDESRIRDTGLRAYQTQKGDFVVAVNWNQRRAYYWPK